MPAALDDYSDLGAVAVEDYSDLGAVAVGEDDYSDLGATPVEDTRPTPSLRADIPAPGKMERGSPAPTALDRAMPALPAQMVKAQDEWDQKRKMVEKREPSAVLDQTFREYDQLKARYGMALELTQDPQKRERLTNEFKRDAQRIGVGVLSEKPVMDVLLDPAVHFPTPSREDMAILFPENGIFGKEAAKIAQVYGSAHRVVAGAATGLTAPIVAGMGVLPPGGKAAVSGAFGVQMGSHVPELARQAGEASVTGDAADVVETAGNLIATSVFATGALAHAAIGKPKAKSESVPFEDGILQRTLDRTEGSLDRALDALGGKPKESPITLAADRAEQTGAPATAAMLKDLTGQPEATAKDSSAVQPEATPKGEIPNEKRIEEGQQKEGVLETEYEYPTGLDPDKPSSWVIYDAEGKPVLETFKEPTGLKPGFRAVPILEHLQRLNDKPAEPPKADALEAATVEATKPLNQLLEDASTPKVGIVPGASGAATLPSLRVPEELLRSDSRDVEARWQSAHGVGEQSVLEKAKTAAIDLKNAFTRHFPKLDPATDGQAIDTLRHFEATPVWAKEMAGQTMRGFTAGFTPEHMNLFERVVILRDLARDVANGQYAGKDIPFGYESEGALRADLSKFERIAQENPGVSDAVNRRTQFMDALRNQMVEEGLLPEKVKENQDYFHRQVMEYMRLKEEATTGTSSRDVRTHTKGFQKTRGYSSKDYNTSYLEAEYEVLSQSFAQLNTVQTLAKLKSANDIRPRLEEAAQAAKEAGDAEATWRDFIPSDHTVWQPKRGNLMYRAQTLSDRIIEQILNGEKLLEEGDLKEVLAVGGKKTEWVIPKRLAETLDDYKARSDDNIAAKLSSWLMYGWKKWTLFSPTRVLRYELNNFSGDLDIAIAAAPGMAKYLKGAVEDSYAYRVKTKAPSTEQLELIRKGVIGSGFFTEEVGGISRNQLLKGLTEPRQGFVERYFNTIEKYHAFREDVLRMAAYRYFKDKLDAGERVYGASKAEEVDAITDKSDKAAKLARELVGDYGNVSRAGQWIRRHLIPFYSWMEINAPRYVRMARNIKNEDAGLRGATRVTGAVAARAGVGAAKFTAKAAGLYALVNLWNQSMFPEEDKELNRDRDQLHVILGRREDGSILSIRFQGAFSDALSWFDLQDYPQDVEEVASGAKSVKQAFLEATIAPINKIANSSAPMMKTALEASIGQSTFPHLVEVKQTSEGLKIKSSPRPIRDPLEHFARLFSVDLPYRYIAKIPTPGVKSDIAKLLSYSTNPGESAYYAAREIVSDFQLKAGKEIAGRLPTDKDNALYYHKQALKYGDAKLAEHWKARYMELGGTEKGIAASIKRADPLGGLTKAERAKFYSELSPEDAAIVAKAEQWYRQTYLPKKAE